MADSEKAVRARLLEHSGTAALVGRRVHYSALPQDPTLPAITLQEMPATPEGTMGNDTGHVRATMQIDAWAPKRAGAQALREQIRDALQRYTGTHEGTALKFVGMFSQAPKYESDGRLWRQTSDFDFWYTESV